MIPPPSRAVHFVQDVLAPAISKGGGTIPFHLFMDLALYDEHHGYYSRPSVKIGSGGDFITAPAISSIFSEIILLEWIHLWQWMGRPQRFTVLELGGGNGQFAHDVWLAARHFPDFQQALSWVMLERGDRTLQQRHLSDMAEVGRCRWIDALEQMLPDGVTGVIFSNEVMDALPVHWLEMTAEGWCEIGVSVDDDGGLCTKLIPLQPPLTNDYLIDHLGADWSPGMRTEVGLVGQQMMHTMGTVLRQGICMTFDYGYPAHEYYSAAFPYGTLTGFFQHQKIENPLEYPGQMDLTAHVDFTALARAGQRAGLETLGFTTQGWYLISLGILDRLEQAQQAQRLAGSDHEQLTQAVKRLVMPNAMGERFKVLLQGRGVAAEALAGLQMNNQKKRLHIGM
ncbi:MAG: SAM-dependent methyltransferase [Magnetococcales bacterium]|nr:SAM-dependent methyltransferase [Magnetococcales bacterium]